MEKGSNSCIMFNKEIMDALWEFTQEDVQTEEGFYAACEKGKIPAIRVDGLKRPAGSAAVQLPP